MLLAGKTPAPKAILGRKVQQVRKALKGFRVYRALKDSRELRVPRARKAHRAKKGEKGERGEPGTPVRIIQVDGQATCEPNEILASVFCPSGGAPDGAKCTSSPTVGICFKKP